MSGPPLHTLEFRLKLLMKEWITFIYYEIPEEKRCYFLLPLHRGVQEHVKIHPRPLAFLASVGVGAFIFELNIVTVSIDSKFSR